jgi:hypothetical protein
MVKFPPISGIVGKKITMTFCGLLDIAGIS